MSLKESFINYFTFNKREINGTIFLLVILFLVIIFSIVTSFSVTEKSRIDESLIAKILFLDSLNQTTPSNGSEFTTYYNQNKFKHQLKPFLFNPNGLSASEWIRMGFSEKQVNVIKNYESKGGRFRRKEDVAKMFVITEEEFAQIESYIQIPEEKSNYIQYSTPKSNYNLPIIDINRADTIELCKLQGIGQAFARRIYKYRNMLGGFYCIEQLLEVWGLDSMKYNMIKSRILVDTTLIVKININTAEFKTLNDHPYIDYNQTKAILNYRKKLGNFRRKEDLKQVSLITEDLYKKLKPYITVR